MSGLSTAEKAVLNDLLAREAATSPEAKREAEAARHELEIRERDERLARDPEYQAQVAEWRRRDESAHREKLNELKALARMTTPPDPRPKLPSDQRGLTILGVGDTPYYYCWECQAPIWGDVVLVGIHTLCTPCDARHQLRCDQCGRHDSLIATRCSDNAWRCDACLKDIQEVPPERRMRSAVMVVQGR